PKPSISSGRSALPKSIIAPLYSFNTFFCLSHLQLCQWFIFLSIGSKYLSTYFCMLACAVSTHNPPSPGKLSISCKSHITKLYVLPVLRPALITTIGDWSRYASLRKGGTRIFGLVWVCKDNGCSFDCLSATSYVYILTIPVFSQPVHSFRITSYCFSKCYISQCCPAILTILFS